MTNLVEITSLLVNKEHPHHRYIFYKDISTLKYSRKMKHILVCYIITIWNLKNDMNCFEKLETELEELMTGSYISIKILIQGVSYN